VPAHYFSCQSAIRLAKKNVQFLSSGILRKAFATQEQVAAVTPQNLRSLIQTIMHDLFAQVRPAGFAATANITLLIIPPKRKAAKRAVAVVFDAQNAIAVEQLLYLKFVLNIDLSHL
jgi:hypothetical protein